MFNSIFVYQFQILKGLSLISQQDYYYEISFKNLSVQTIGDSYLSRYLLIE